MYQPGDRVLYREFVDSTPIPATVRFLDTDGSVAIEFDTEGEIGHDCNGTVPSGRGWYAWEEHLELNMEDDLKRIDMGDLI